MNFRDSYLIDGLSTAARPVGGLPGLLQQVMLQQFGFDPSTGISKAGQASELVQPRVLPVSLRPAPTIRQRPSNISDGSTDDARDPNFRQLVSRQESVVPRSNDGSYPDAASTPDRLAAVYLPPSLFGRDPTANAQPSSTAPAISAPAPNGPACFPIPGKTINPGSSIWPLPADKPSAEPWELIKKLWQNLAVSRPVEDVDDAKDIGDKKFSEYPYCNRQYKEEVNECTGRAEDGTHPDFVRACYERALERMNQCEENDGMPDLVNGPRKWSDRDEEVSYYPNRPYRDPGSPSGSKKRAKPRRR